MKEQQWQRKISNENLEAHMRSEQSIVKRSNVDEAHIRQFYHSYVAYTHIRWWIKKQFYPYVFALLDSFVYRSIDTTNNDKIEKQILSFVRKNI